MCRRRGSSTNRDVEFSGGINESKYDRQGILLYLYEFRGTLFLSSRSHPGGLGCEKRHNIFMFSDTGHPDVMGWLQNQGKRQALKSAVAEFRS